MDIGYTGSRREKTGALGEAQYGNKDLNDIQMNDNAFHNVRERLCVPMLMIVCFEALKLAPFIDNMVIEVFSTEQRAELFRLGVPGDIGKV